VTILLLLDRGTQLVQSVGLGAFSSLRE